MASAGPCFTSTRRGAFRRHTGTRVLVGNKNGEGAKFNPHYLFIAVLCRRREKKAAPHYHQYFHYHQQPLLPFSPVQPAPERLQFRLSAASQRYVKRGGVKHVSLAAVPRQAAGRM